MKRIVICLLAMCLCTGGLFAAKQKEKPVVAVTPFVVASGYVDDEDIDYLTHSFFVKLGQNDKVRVTDRQHMVKQIMKELEFQESHWSEPNKLAVLGNALNADLVVRGELRKRGSNILLMVSFIDIATRAVKGTAQMSFASADEAYEKMDTLVDELFRSIDRQQQQQTQKLPVVAVTPFEVSPPGFVDEEDVEYLTAMFFNKLVVSGKVGVMSRGVMERVLRESQFQTGDWSEPNKLAVLGKALNADLVVRGELKKRGSNILLTVSFFDIATRAVKGTAQMRFASAEEAFDKMDALADALLRSIER